MITGVCHFYSETGTEGGHWAFQDEKFIFEDAKMPTGIRWSYEGLHVLTDGDHLKIFNPDGSVYWEGEIKLKRHPLFTETVDVGDEDTKTALGFWIHADQDGVERYKWAKPFFEEYKAELELKQ